MRMIYSIYHRAKVLFNCHFKFLEFNMQTEKSILKYYYLHNLLSAFIAFITGLFYIAPLNHFAYKSRKSRNTFGYGGWCSPWILAILDNTFETLETQWLVKDYVPECDLQQMQIHKKPNNRVNCRSLVLHWGYRLTCGRILNQHIVCSNMLTVSYQVSFFSKFDI